MGKWPPLYKVKQHFDHPVIEDIEYKVKRELDNLLESLHLPPGAKIAIPAGSRGITNIVAILRTIVERLQALNYQPFLFSAMGSHGGGTVEGQKKILDSLGITEENIGCPISVSTDVLEIGVTDTGMKGLPVYMAKEAYESDGIIVVNRIKTHTSFSGPYESGLLKMMAVGMGRVKGAVKVHSLGAEHLAESIPSIAKKIMDQAPILGGIGIVENAKEQTALIQGIKKEDIFKEEKQLLILSKTYLTQLSVNNIDFAVVLEMGKNYSGTGMDTNVIGRLRIEGIPEPKEPNIRYLAVLDLSEASHGNATGIGLADFTTQRLVDKIDKKSTYLNCMTSGFVIRAAVPMTFDHDRALFDGVFDVLKPENPSTLNMVILKNTLHIDELWVSEKIYHQLKKNKGLSVIEGPVEIQFDSNHQLML